MTLMTIDLLRHSIRSHMYICKIHFDGLKFFTGLSLQPNLALVCIHIHTHTHMHSWFYIKFVILPFMLLCTSYYFNLIKIAWCNYGKLINLMSNIYIYIIYKKKFVQENQRLKQCYIFHIAPRGVSCAILSVYRTAYA